VVVYVIFMQRYHKILFIFCRFHLWDMYYRIQLVSYLFPFVWTWINDYQGWNPSGFLSFKPLWYRPWRMKYKLLVVFGSYDGKNNELKLWNLCTFLRWINWHKVLFQYLYCYSNVILQTRNFQCLSQCLQNSFQSYRNINKNVKK